MPEKRPPTGKAARILQRRQPANAEELAAANRTIDGWQAQVWALPVADRQAALLTLLEVLDG